MSRFMCVVCDWTYDEDAGYPDDMIPVGTKWDALKENFECPECGTSKEDFEEIVNG